MPAPPRMAITASTGNSAGSYVIDHHEKEGRGSKFPLEPGTPMFSPNHLLKEDLRDAPARFWLGFRLRDLEAESWIVPALKR